MRRLCQKPARPDADPPLKCFRGATVCDTFSLPVRLSGDTLLYCVAIVSPIRNQRVTLRTTADALPLWAAFKQRLGLKPKNASHVVRGCPGPPGILFQPYVCLLGKHVAGDVAHGPKGDKSQAGSFRVGRPCRNVQGKYALWFRGFGGGRAATALGLVRPHRLSGV